MRKRTSKTRRAKVSVKRGSAHTQTYFVRSPTSGIIDVSIVSGVSVAEDEKLPRTPRWNTNSKQGPSMWSRLREGAGQ